MKRLPLAMLLTVALVSSGCCCFRKSPPVAAAPVCVQPVMACAPNPCVTCPPGTYSPQAVSYGMTSPYMAPGQ